MNFSRVLFLILITFLCKIVYAVDPAELRQLWNTPTQLTVDGETFGVEVEGILPSRDVYLAHQSVKFEVVKILNDLKSSIPEITNIKPHPIAGYVEFDFNEQTHMFSIKTDATIKAPNGTFGIEVTSPVMHDDQELEIFTRIISELSSRLSYNPEPTSTGLHVHFGFIHSSEEEKKLALFTFEMLEPALNARFKPNIGRRFHISSIAGQTDRWIKSGYDFKGFLASIHGEYRSVRMSHLAKAYGTIEARFFNSTVKPEEIKEYANFIRSLMKMIRLRDPQLLRMLRGKNSPETFLNWVVSSSKLECMKLFE